MIKIWCLYESEKIIRNTLIKITHEKKIKINEIFKKTTGYKDTQGT